AHPGARGGRATVEPWGPSAPMARQPLPQFAAALQLVGQFWHTEHEIASMNWSKPVGLSPRQLPGGLRQPSQQASSLGSTEPLLFVSHIVSHVAKPPMQSTTQSSSAPVSSTTPSVLRSHSPLTGSEHVSSHAKSWSHG